MKPNFLTLTLLTFATALLLAPFALSPFYLPIIRDNNFQFYQLLHGEIYKQVTGYLSLLFVVLEMVLTARKRGRGWKIQIKLPGSIRFWRSLHIFLGLGLLVTTLVHTIGAQGLNFNAIFLWVFFGVIVSALVGAVAETGILESPQKFFGFVPNNLESKSQSRFWLPKGVLIRKLRLIWLNTHIFLVNAFIVMLAIHIFIAYYYQ